jgi:hypothetical protein
LEILKVATVDRFGLRTGLVFAASSGKFDFQKNRLIASCARWIPAIRFLEHQAGWREPGPSAE